MDLQLSPEHRTTLLLREVDGTSYLDIARITGVNVGTVMSRLFYARRKLQRVGRRVAVVGGGNVAMDCARTALRLGAEATIVYRRSRAELPARLEEVENAEEEGVQFRYLTLPLKTIGDDHFSVEALECQKMELGEPDASGRRSPVPVPGSEFILPFDCVIHAIGNGPNTLIPRTTPGLTIGKKGNVVIDLDTGKTSKERVWAGGDIATGAATVISAMGAGRKAASSIHEFLMS